MKKAKSFLIPLAIAAFFVALSSCACESNKTATQTVAESEVTAISSAQLAADSTATLN